MEKIVTRNFSCEKDFERVNDFLSKTQQYEGIYNWDNARWSFNRYCTHSREELSNNRTWEQSVQIWENDKGKIAGVANAEEPGDYFFQVHPDYKYLEEEMLLWAMDNCRKFYPHLDKMVVSSGSKDYERKNLYKKYEAEKLDFTDENRTVELKENYSMPQFAKDYKIINLDGSNLEACTKVSDLYTYVWPTSTYMSNGETVAAMTNSISFRKELSFIVADDKDEYAAFTIAWVDSLNKVASFYPVAVNPNYLNTNILEVMLKTALNKLISLGFQKASIGAWYTEEENRVFESLGLAVSDFEEIYNIKL